MRDLPKQNTLVYIPELDGLRAVAIFLVLCSHLKTGIPPLDQAGGVGVDIFFVLSGYLITRILIVEIRERQSLDLKRFYAKRLIRLWPALLVVIGLMFVPGYLLLGQSSFVLSSLFAAFYLTPIGNGLFDVHGIYSYTWTLSLEEYFYLAFPVILVYMIRRRLSRRQMVWLLSGTSGLLLITMGVAGLGQFGKPIGLIDLFSVAGIGLGCALALSREAQITNPRKVFGPIGVSLIALALIAGMPSPLVGFSHILADLGTVAIVLAISSQAAPRLARFLSLRWLVFVGVISYEIYLWHGILQGLVGTVGEVTPLLAGFIAYPLAFIAAACTHYALKPLQRRMRSVLDKRENDPTKSLRAGLITWS